MTKLVETRIEQLTIECLQPLGYEYIRPRHRARWRMGMGMGMEL
ncbi:MAG: hypothetical protein WD625_05135 [Balneolales bacterium]